MTELEQNFTKISRQINNFCEKYYRPADLVKLVAVSKVHPVEKIIRLAKCGQRDFAENYLQEALEKIQHCNFAGLTDLQWHFIGHIQSRKCREIAENFNWVHTIDSIKVAEKLNKYRSQPLNVLLQVNIESEQTKSGVSPEEAMQMASDIESMANLSLRGLMIIPRAHPTLDAQREVFAQCRSLLESLVSCDLIQNRVALDQLSMGMTNDMEAAIAEGATMVRIGTALFGQRPPKV